jgi:hypothetical protein
MGLAPLASHTALIGCLFLACGGRADGIGPSSGSSSGSSGSSGGGGSSGASGSSSGASGSSSGGGSCVEIDIATYDTSCNTPADCIYITSGQVCDGFCSVCGDSLVNASETARYEAATASLVSGTCGCFQSTPQCTNHHCTQQAGDADASAPVDAAACVYVDLSTYDTSCTTDADCIEITPGRICSGDCACGGAIVNADGESRYEQTIAPLKLGGCPCISAGTPRCIQGQCTRCNRAGLNNPPGCPDGG